MNNLMSPVSRGPLTRPHLPRIPSPPNCTCDQAFHHSGLSEDPNYTQIIAGSEMPKTDIDLFFCVFITCFYLSTYFRHCVSLAGLELVIFLPQSSLFFPNQKVFIIGKDSSQNRNLASY
jgi:hypothetical protein